MENIFEKMQTLSYLKNHFKKLKNEFDIETEELQNQIKELENEIESQILLIEESIKTDELDAIYNKGRESWDGKILKGYAVAHPEILAARKIGNPTVSFRLKNQK